MKTRSQEPYWLLKNGLMTSYPSLQDSIICNTLIVGGGITGALMAYQFGKAGYQVVLVDKRNIAFGSTSATTALLQYEIDEPLIRLRKEVGDQLSIAAYMEGVKAIDKLQQIITETQIYCGFTKKKSLYLARSQKDADWMFEEYKARREVGLAVRWYTKKETNTRYKAVAEGAIESDIGASMDAYSFTQQLLEYCCKNFNVRVFDHTAVRNINYQVDLQHTANVTGDKLITFQNLIYATGYETTMPRKNKVRLISTYAFISEPVADLPAELQNTIFWDTQEPYFYLRTTDDNRILAGGADEKFKNALKRDLLIEKKEEDLLAQLKLLFPQIHVVPDFSWGGTFGVTKDALPYIGADPEKPDTYYVLGFGGNGITFSVMGMKIIEDLIAGRENLLASYFKFDR